MSGPELKFRVGPMEKPWKKILFDEDNSWGYPDVFGRPWEETVYEESGHFPDGRLTVEIAAIIGGEECWRMGRKEERQT